ncbi:MAG: transposase [Planctomycetes bacterium]|nr:transposase [Planctomycetota bacterium]
MVQKRHVVDDQLYVHFITFSVYRKRKLLSRDVPKRFVLGTLNRQLKEFGAACIGFVIMPDHVHALIWLPKTHQLAKFMRAWKRSSSMQIRNWLQKRAPEYCLAAGESPRFWQPKYYAFEIYEPDKLHEKLVYMHNNPVKAGLVEQATDWRWSSARWYDQQRTVGVPITWID